MATTKNNQRFGGELLAKYSAKLEEKKRETAAPDPGEKPNHDQLQTVANKLQYAVRFRKLSTFEWSQWPVVCFGYWH